MPYPIPSMMDGWPAGYDGWTAGYDGWMANIHDRWMEATTKKGAGPTLKGPGLGPRSIPNSCCCHQSVDGGHVNLVEHGGTW